MDLARKVGGPIVVRPDDRVQLEQHLKAIYEQFEHNALGVKEWNSEWIRRELTKVELTKKLVNLLN